MWFRSRRVASALVALGVLTPSSALAGTFADDGSFAFDEDALVAVGFEAGDVPDAPVGPVESPLEGDGALVLDVFGSVGVVVTLPREPRRLRASVWVRGGETVAAISFYGDDVALGIDALAQLYPTGRMTSDGWVELANEIRYDGASSAVTSVSFFAPSGAEVDALEILDAGPLGPDEIATTAEGTSGLGGTCEGATDGSGCPVGATCLYGRCRDVTGGVPPIPPNRDAVTEYLAARLELIFGPFENREIDLPVARIALERMRNATDAYTFWNGFLLAVRRLHDGHTSASTLSDFYLRNQRPISLCFIEGDADLTQGAAPSDPGYLDVLVSHAGADRNLGMRRGDRLLRVDGRHPIAWARSLIEIHSLSPISNHETFAELAEQLRGLVARYAHTLEIVRCDEEGTCGDVELIDLDAELPLLAEGVAFDGVACDNRPLRHLETSPLNHAAESGDSVYGGLVLGTDAAEKIYGLEWESLYTSNGSDGVGDALDGWVDTWRDEEAAGVILDHRSGNGGTLAAPAILWDYFVPRRESDAYVDRQRGGDERPTLAEGQAIFQAARDLGLVNVVGTESPEGAGVKVALLLTRDVSASDWLPLGLKGSPNARIFAPFETNGAFSTRYMLSYWLGMSYVLASGDTFVPSGETLNGHGVEPDVRVLPLQSDLVQGRDTVFEAALAWLREPAPPPPPPDLASANRVRSARQKGTAR